MVATGDEDVPMSDAQQPPRPGPGHAAPGSASAAAPPPAQPVTKPKRRFAPQLVEHTTRSSNKPANNDANPNPNADIGSRNKGAIANATQSTKDAAVQANESDIASSRPPTKTIRPLCSCPYRDHL
ncbi:hypothetical protein NPX13_g6552 [Xylaria arbuscula]|uniref:Uncharacterized protein n=1 Tax=Xylaria arbuscula TaxID=114810 RepID=A0A9W8NCN0_9PEZI|nr:hypothetical protein NPX13_g6552 [Xylaria arbuscula]